MAKYKFHHLSIIVLVSLLALFGLCLSAMGLVNAIMNVEVAAIILTALYVACFVVFGLYITVPKLESKSFFRISEFCYGLILVLQGIVAPIPAENILVSKVLILISICLFGALFLFDRNWENTKKSKTILAIMVVVEILLAVFYAIEAPAIGLEGSKSFQALIVLRPILILSIAVAYASRMWEKKREK